MAQVDQTCVASDSEHSVDTKEVISAHQLESCPLNADQTVLEDLGIRSRRLHGITASCHSSSVVKTSFFFIV